MSRTAADILADFGLDDLLRKGLPVTVLQQRVTALAQFAADYHASFESQSQLLQQRTRQLRVAKAAAAAKPDPTP